MSATAPPKLSRGSALRVMGEIALGTVLDGKYRIESVLGRGGMAVVFAASHVTLGHAVAIKVLKPDASAAPEQAERIVREARAAAGLTSENATRVLDIGTLDSGEPYIVMERLVGVDLGQLLQAHGPLSVQHAASYLVQACDAIAEAHARHVVHRDLKPSNLFLTSRREGTPLIKLMDFGISKVVSESPEESLTATQDSLGTPHYMSPEQLMTSREVDTRTDIWSLGVILYRLLTGEHPFVGETTPAVHVAVAAHPAPKLRDMRPDAPPELERLVLDCLVKSRTERLQTVQDFAAVLLAFADEDTRRRYAHLNQPARPHVTSPRGADQPLDITVRLAGDPETHAAWGTSRSRQSAQTRRGALVLGLSAVAAAGVVVGSWRLVGRGAPSGVPPEGSVTGSVSQVATVTDPATSPATRPSESEPMPTTSSAPMPSSAPGAGSARRRTRPSGPPPMAPTVPRLDPYGQRR